MGKGRGEGCDYSHAITMLNVPSPSPPRSGGEGRGEGAVRSIDAGIYSEIECIMNQPSFASSVRTRLTSALILPRSNSNFQPALGNHSGSRPEPPSASPWL